MEQANRLTLRSVSRSAPAASGALDFFGSIATESCRVLLCNMETSGSVCAEKDNIDVAIDIELGH